MEKNNHTPNSLHISEDVVETVVRETVKEMNGTVELTNLQGKITLMSASAAKPVRVSVTGEVAELDVGILVGKDAQVKSVCEELQRSLKETVQNMTGIPVAKVNVHVLGIASSKEN